MSTFICAFFFVFFSSVCVDNMPKLLKKIQTGAFAIPSTIEPSAGDLLRKAMCLDPTHRLSVPAMLQHPWLALSPEERVAKRAAASARRHSLRKTARAAAKAMASAAAAAAAAAEEEEEEEEARRQEAAEAAAAGSTFAAAPLAHEGPVLYSALSGGPSGSHSSVFGACSLPKIGGLPWPQPTSPSSGAEPTNLWPSWDPPASAFGNYSNYNSSCSNGIGCNGSSNGNTNVHHPFNGYSKDFIPGALPRPTTTTTSRSATLSSVPYPHQITPMLTDAGLPYLQQHQSTLAPAVAAAAPPATPPITPPLLWPEHDSSSGNAPMDLLDDDNERSPEPSPWSPFKAAKALTKESEEGAGRNAMPPLRLGGGGAPTIAIPRPPGVCAGNATSLQTGGGAAGGGFMGPSSWGASNIATSRSQNSHYGRQPITMAADSARVCRVASDGYRNDTTHRSSSSSSSRRGGSLRSVAFSSYDPNEACALAGLSPAVVQQVATGAAAANAFGVGRSAAEVLPLVVASLARSSPRCAAVAAASSSSGGGGGASGTISPFLLSPNRNRKRANSLGLDSQQQQQQMGYGDGSGSRSGGAQRACRAVSLSLPAQKGGAMRARRALSLRQPSANGSSGHGNGNCNGGVGISVGNVGGVGGECSSSSSRSSSRSSSSSSSSSSVYTNQGSPMCPSSYPSTPAWALPQNPQWRFSGDQHHDKSAATHASSSSDDSVGSGCGSGEGPHNPLAATTASSSSPSQVTAAPKLTSTDRALRTSYAILESKLEDEAAARAESSAQVVGGSYGRNHSSSKSSSNGASNHGRCGGDVGVPIAAARARGAKGSHIPQTALVTPPSAAAAGSGLSGLLSTPISASSPTGNNTENSSNGNNSNGKHGGGSTLDRCLSLRPLKLPALESSPMTKLAGGAAAIELDSSESEDDEDDEEDEDAEEDDSGGESCDRPLCFAPPKKATSTAAAAAAAAAASELPRRHWTVGIRSKMDAPRVADRVSWAVHKL